MAELLPPVSYSLLWSLSDGVSYPSVVLSELHTPCLYLQRPLDYHAECENTLRAHTGCFLNSPDIFVCLRQFQYIAQAVLKLSSPASTL